MKFLRKIIYNDKHKFGIWKLKTGTNLLLVDRKHLKARVTFWIFIFQRFAHWAFPMSYN